EITVGELYELVARNALGGRLVFGEQRLVFQVVGAAGHGAGVSRTRIIGTRDDDFDFGNLVVDDFQARGEAGESLVFIGDAEEADLAGFGIVGVDLVGAPAVGGLPESFAERHFDVVFGVADFVCVRQLRGVVSGYGGHVLVDEAVEAGAVAVARFRG